MTRTSFSNLGPTKYQKTKNYLYQRYSEYKLRLFNALAPWLNSPNYVKVKELMINLLVTSLVWSFVFYCFSITSYVRIGSGTAIILYSVQYYIRWFYTVKPKADTLRVKLIK